MVMFKALQHLLPNARAWRTTSEKALRRFLVGLAESADDVREYFGRVYAELWPSSTGSIPEWEDQLGLPPSRITEAQRRERLDGAWKALGGQDPAYIQRVLRANGFDVYVHEWWEPGTQPPVGAHQCVTPRNPLLYIRRSTAPRVQLAACGYSATTCGNISAICGNGVEPAGYPLVNKVQTSRKTYSASCGNVSTSCGNAPATCGNFDGYRLDVVDYLVPLDSTKWPHFLYVGGQTFPEFATVDVDRRNEFEALCLKICPTHVWIGVLVKYT